MYKTCTRNWPKSSLAKTRASQAAAGRSGDPEETWQETRGRPDVFLNARLFRGAAMYVLRSESAITVQSKPAAAIIMFMTNRPMRPLPSRVRLVVDEFSLERPIIAFGGFEKSCCIRPCAPPSPRAIAGPREVKGPANLLERKYRLAWLMMRRSCVREKHWRSPALSPAQNRAACGRAQPPRPSLKKSQRRRVPYRRFACQA